jgi:DNA-binding PadR family transcriptional regulator
MFRNFKEHGLGCHGRGHGRGGERGDDLREQTGRPGRERMFEQGDIRLVVLHLLQEKPRHGYEIIKAIQDLAGGEYSPSPGVIYPTLTMLEDIGQARIGDETGGKKQYAITGDGEAFLASQGEVLERILSRLSAAGSFSDARRPAELQRSMQNLKMALRLRMERGGMESEVLRKIADILDRAAVEIERC